MYHGDCRFPVKNASLELLLEVVKYEIPIRKAK